MRGFAFIGGEGPPNSFDLPLAGSDLIVAADSGLQAVEARGLRADWIVGDMDSLVDPSMLSSYPPDRIKKYPRDKDYTDTELALALLRELGCDDIAVVGGGGGRLDHLLAVAAVFERPVAPDRWITRVEDVACLDAARKECSLSIQASPGTLVSLFPMGRGPWKAASEGLQWPLAGLEWTRGSFGISNVVLSSECRIDAASGRFLVILPLGASWRRHRASD